MRDTVLPELPDSLPSCKLPLPKVIPLKWMIKGQEITQNMQHETRGSSDRPGEHSGHGRQNDRLQQVVPSAHHEALNKILEDYLSKHCHPWVHLYNYRASHPHTIPIRCRSYHITQNHLATSTPPHEHIFHLYYMHYSHTMHIRS